MHDLHLDLDAILNVETELEKKSRQEKAKTNQQRAKRKHVSQPFVGWRELLRVLKKGSNPQEEKSDLHKEKKNPQEEKTNPQEEKANRQLRRRS